MSFLSRVEAASYEEAGYAIKVVFPHLAASRN